MRTAKRNNKTSIYYTQEGQAIRVNTVPARERYKLEKQQEENTTKGVFLFILGAAIIAGVLTMTGVINLY
jgi:hypothetical protein